MGIALAAAVIAAAAPAAAAPASERYEDGLAAYQRNDFEKSLKTLRPLAEKGDARAMYIVGRHYQFGQAVKPDRAEAYFWYKRAEAKGHNEAKLFRQLLEQRWKISAADKARAEQKLAAAKAPPRPKPRESATLREKAAPPKPPEKPVAKVAEPAKPKAPPKAEPKPEPAKAKPSDTFAVARPAPPRENAPPTVVRGNQQARVPAPPSVREADEDDDGPPPETRAPVAAAPPSPPPGHDDGPSYAPPSPPYYAPSPAPYYAPPPPRHRVGVYYGPRVAYRPAYRAAWGYHRPYARGYVHPGWRAGVVWNGRFRGGFRGRW